MYAFNPCWNCGAPLDDEHVARLGAALAEAFAKAPDAELDDVLEAAGVPDPCAVREARSGRMWVVTVDAPRSRLTVSVTSARVRVHAIRSRAARGARSTEP